MMADENEQEGWANTIYQAGGYYINDDKTKAGFDDPATQKGIAEYIGWQTDYDFLQPRVISLILVKQNVSSPVKAL